MENNEITLDILYKYFSDQASEKEIDAILAWLDKESSNKEEFAKAKKIFIETTNSYSNAKEQGRIAYLNLEKRIGVDKSIKAQTSYNNSINFVVRYAALFLILLGLTVTAYILGKSNNNIFSKEDFYVVDVPYGGKSSITLPDGSTIHLNAGSKLKYNKNLGINTREIYLEGEGLFEVEKDKRPMIVHTSHIDIEVLGTVFNVKSYIDEDNIEATLLKGSIKVETLEEKLDVPIYLKPNEKLVYNKTDSEIAINKNLIDSSDKHKENDPLQKDLLKKKYKITSNVDVYTSVAWKDGKYIFTGETLEQLATILTRKFDITFSFENEEMKNITYSGTLRDYPIEQVLEALSLTSPVIYQIKEKNVYLALDKEKLKTYHKLMNN